MTASSVRVLNQNLYDNLINNRILLITNVSIDEDVIRLCTEKNIINPFIAGELQSSSNNAEKIDCIIEALKMKKSNYFNDFCEVLVICGHPMLADILTGTLTLEFNINIDDIWDEIPTLKKTVTRKEKELLLKYITDKVRVENVKSLLNQPVENQNRASAARINQVEQSWKFQKEVKGKEQEKNNLKIQLSTIEEKLVEKQKQLQTLKEEYNVQKQNQEIEISVATKFNTANDKEIQRKEQSLSLYRSSVSKTLAKIRCLIQSSSKADEKLVRESSDSQIRKYDTDKQMKIFENVFEKLIEQYNDLVKEMVHYDNLKTEVHQIMRSFRSDSSATSSETLTSTLKHYQLEVNNKIQSLHQQLEVQDKFILGILPPEEIPERFKNITIPSKERNEYLAQISELNNKINYLEALLSTKEKDAGDSIQDKSRPQNVHTGGDIREEMRERYFVSEKQTKETFPPLLTNIPFSYSSKHTKREANLNLKNKKTNVLKTNVVSFI